MNAILYNNQSELNKVGKTLVQLASSVVVLKDETSITDPVMTFTGHLPMVCNYLYLQETQRYYFVTNIKSVRNNVWELSCHVDVLESFKTGIKNQTAIISRQEKLWNLYLNDGQFKQYQNPVIFQKAFPNGFDSYPSCYVLAVAGGGNN